MQSYFWRPWICVYKQNRVYVQGRENGKIWLRSECSLCEAGPERKARGDNEWRSIFINEWNVKLERMLLGSRNFSVYPRDSSCGEPLALGKVACAAGDWVVVLTTCRRHMATFCIVVAFVARTQSGMQFGFLGGKLVHWSVSCGKAVEHGEWLAFSSTWRPNANHGNFVG